MKNKLKIAIYSGDIPSTTFIERLIRGISNKGHEIYLFGYIKDSVSYNQSVSVFGYKNTKIQKGIYLLKYSFLLYFFKNKEKAILDKILKSKSKNILLDKVKSYPVLWHKPDIFHLQWAKGLADWIWVKEFGIKMVLSLRGAHINYSPIASTKLANMYRNNFPKIDAFHAVSKDIAQEAIKYNAQQEKIKVVYSGLDLELKTTFEKTQTKVFKIISIGRPHWIKGYTYALDACKMLKDNNLKFEYTIIGAANNIEFDYQIHDLNLQNEVNLLGQMPFEDVKTFIQSSDLLLLPSLKEGVANVVLEAMSLRTLVLTTDCGGIREVIIDGENGFMTPIRDSEKMADKIIEISNISEEKKDALLLKAITTVKNNHNEQKMIESMSELYQCI
jgi:colanic acid/amylovoran biosynthesis glycosyltransferase